MKLKTPLIVVLLTIFGTAMSRWHGGGFVGGSPKQLKNFLWALPFSLSVALSWYIGEYEWLAIAGASLFTLAWAMVFKSTGHGGGIDLGTSYKEPGEGRTVEKLEYLILFLHSRIDRYWYDFIMLTLIGFVGALLPAILIGIVSVPAGLLVLAGGILKGIAYMIGWKIHPRGTSEVPDILEEFSEATEVGEALTGLFAFLGLGIAVTLLL